jgi:hypothetical protein
MILPRIERSNQISDLSGCLAVRVLRIDRSTLECPAVIILGRLPTTSVLSLLQQLELLARMMH